MAANTKGDAKGRPKSPNGSSPSRNISPSPGSSTSQAQGNPTTTPTTPGERAPAKAVSPPSKSDAGPSKTPAEKLITVVAAASAAAPPPSGAPTVRPPLASDKPAETKQPPKPLTFAQAAGGAAGKPAGASATQDVVGKYIAPRPNPPEAQLRNRSERGLQDLFHRRWHSEQHGVCFENARGVNSERYLEAIAKVVPLHQVFAMGPIGQGTILVTLNSVEAANELLAKGINLAGRHIIAYPEARKPQRVVLSPVHPRVDDQCLVDFLSRFGKVQGRIRGLPLRLGEKGLARGIFSLSREAFITLNPGVQLPPGFRLIVEGSVTYVELATEARCYGCRQIGHQISRCPKRAPKEAPTRPQGKAPSGTQTATPSGTRAVGPSGLPTAGPSGTPTAGPSSVHTAGLPEPQSAAEVTTSDEEASAAVVAGAEGPKKRRRRKKKGQQLAKEAELMPPPAPKEAPKIPKPAASAVSTPAVSGSEAEKRPRSDDGEEQAPAPKAPAVAAADVSDLSDADISPMPRSRAVSSVGYDTDASGVSVGSGAEIEEGPLNRSQLRDLVKKVSSKKNIDVFKKIVTSFTTRYYGLVSQMEALAEEAKNTKQYNQEAKLRRIIAKIEVIAEGAEERPTGER